MKFGRCHDLWTEINCVSVLIDEGVFSWYTHEYRPLQVKADVVYTTLSCANTLAGDSSLNYTI
jgi:hypothetical protein